MNKIIMQLCMHGCNVVIIAYRVCQLCASYSAMINLTMFNFREIYIFTSKKYYYEINKNTFKFELILKWLLIYWLNHYYF